MKVMYCRAAFFILLMTAHFFISSCAAKPRVAEPVPPPAIVKPPEAALYRDVPLSIRPYEVFGTWYYPVDCPQSYVEEGIASWYGKKFHQKPTSSGQIYNMYGLTAAHKTLPLGAHVKVTNLKNQKEIILTINDRGPFVEGRIIDLSYGAAKAIGMVQDGIVPVRVEAVQLASKEFTEGQERFKVEHIKNFHAGSFTIQVASFENMDSAVRLQHQMAEAYGSAHVRTLNTDGRQLHRVFVGKFSGLSEAEHKLAELKQKGFKGSFVVADDPPVQ